MSSTNCLFNAMKTGQISIQNYAQSLLMATKSDQGATF